MVLIFLINVIILIILFYSVYLIYIKLNSNQETSGSSSGVVNTKRPSSSQSATIYEYISSSDKIILNTVGLSKCESELSQLNVCKDTIIKTSLPNNGGTVLDCTGMYPGVPLDNPEFGTNITYGVPNDGEYTMYDTTSGLPGYFDVAQTLLGNCVFDSFIALLAYKQPGVIKNMIFSLDDPHTYLVQFFYEDKALLIKITDEMPLDNRTIFVNGASYENSAFDIYVKDSATQLPIMWSHLLLKAFACVIGYYPDFLDYPRQYKPNEGYDAINEGVEGVGLLNAITNQESFFINKNYNKYYNDFNENSWLFVGGSHNTKFVMDNPGYDSSSQQMSWNNGWTILVVPDQGFVFYDPEEVVKASIIKSHGYSVLGYDSNTESIQLRNPWGTYSILSGYSYENGIMNVPIVIFEYIYQCIYCVYLEA